MTAERPFNSWDAVKLLGLVLMCVDHASLAWFNLDIQQYWLRAVGRGAAPIFFFLTGLAQSYRFRTDLLVLAVLISATEWMLSGRLYPLNILFTILFCRALLSQLEKRNPIKQPYYAYIACLIWVWSASIIEYGSMGVCFALAGYLQRQNSHDARRFLLLSFVAFGIFTLFFNEPAVSPGITFFTLICVYYLLSRLRLKPILVEAPASAKLLKTISRHSGYIYALSVIAAAWVHNR